LARKTARACFQLDADRDHDLIIVGLPIIQTIGWGRGTVLMGRYIRWVLFGVLAIFWGGRLAMADSIELAHTALELQRKGQSQEALELYSQVLQDKDLPESFLASLYNNRAAAYTREGLYDSALLDYYKSLDLEADSIPVMNNRGALFAKLGHYANAIDDYSEALRLRPKFGKAFSNRGNAYFYLENFEAAVEDYLKALKFNTGDRYRTVIWLYMAREAMGDDGWAELDKNLETLSEEDWPAPVALMFLGRMTPQQMQAAAFSDDPMRDRERKAEALFYMGYYYLLQGVPDLAQTYFRRTIQAGVHYLVEFTGACAALGLAPAAPAKPKLGVSTRAHNRSQIASTDAEEVKFSQPSEPTLLPLESKGLQAIAEEFLSNDMPGYQSDGAPKHSAKSQSSSIFEATVRALKNSKGLSDEGVRPYTYSDRYPKNPDLQQLDETVVVHLFSTMFQESAKHSVLKLRQQFPNLFSAVAIKISQVDLKNDSPVFRVLAGPFANQAQATAFCDEVKRRGVDERQYCSILTY